MQKTNKYYKSVTKLLDRKFPRKVKSEGTRGEILHDGLVKFYQKIFKTSNRSNKTNYRVFSKGMTKVYNDILSDFQKYPKSELFYEDLKVLLNTHLKQIIYVAKSSAKLNNYIIVPEEVEKELLGGEAELELQAIGKIGGINIPARVDLLITLGEDYFKVRDFKSYILEPEDDPSNPDSENYRDFMQTCLYGGIFEMNRDQRCTAIELMYFPNKILSYDFTDDLREKAVIFALDTAFEGFEGITFNERDDKNMAVDDCIVDSPEVLTKDAKIIQVADHDTNSLGWINTVKGKPFKIIRGKENKIEGYLFIKVAEQVRENSLLKVETNEGTILGCKVEKIECFEHNVSGETASHKEEIYKITLNPEVEITPEGCCKVRPQTIISGKIKKLTIQEFYQYKKIPQNGLPIGAIEGLIDDTPYRLNLRILYQSCFIGGVQNTGKTSALRYLIMLLAQQKNAPAQIIFDAEEEYLGLTKIPTNHNSVQIMKKYGIKQINSNNFKIIKFGRRSQNCLTLKAIDSLDLPLFLHELTSITHSTLQRLIKDILDDNKGKNFTFPELKQLILKYVDFQDYRLNPNTKSAIERALMPITLDLFDKMGGSPVNIESMLESGKITVIDCFDSNDEEQRLIALFLLCALHKYKMKRRNKEYGSGVLFYLDEIQRLLPKLLSNSDSQKRIVHYLGEIHHRGRKRKYGVIYATQSPLDIKKDIIDLCNIKIFFQIQGDASNLLKEYLNKEERERLKQLPIGYAFITSIEKHEPVEIKFPYFN